MISPTPDTTSEPVPTTPEVSVVSETTAEPTAEADTASTELPISPSATASPTPARTERPANFPTPVNARIQVVEQLFEGGRMFWLEPTREIWVMRVTAEGGGTWSVYQDTWDEAVDPESDSALTPPEGRTQPIRGFGKVWREVPNLRDELGWAVTPEFGFISEYQYVAGGTVDANGQYTAGPGYHVVYSLYGEQFRFNEIDSTWQLGGA
ncbi:MAG: hypothetical protein SF162_03255 [bacterium]|nr:hypothetical protein [bacterium]